MDEKKGKKIIKIIDIVPPGVKEEKPVESPEGIQASPLQFEDLGEEEIIQSEEPKIEEERIFSEDLFVSKPKKKKKTFILTGVICFIVLGIIFCFTLSKAEIIIKPKTEIMQFQTELNIDKNVAFIDLGSNKIPGQLFKVEKSGQKEFKATQEKDLREKAKGVIIVYNQYSSAPQTLVQATRFISKEDKLFRTTRTVVIPGAKIEGGKIIPSSINVEVEASEAGEKYNIESSSFTIPGFKGTAKYTGFYGESTQSMIGGLVGKVKVVSEDDIQGAKDVLAVELKDVARKELEKRIPSNLKILKDTILEEIVESSSSVEADQPADEFTIEIKVTAKALGFIESDGVSLINDNLKGKISEDKVVLSDTIEISYTIVDINLEKGIAKLACEVKENIAWEVDTKKIKQELAGKNEIEVRQYLTSRTEIESAKIVFWPFWVKRIPSKEKKIKITID